MSGHIDVHHHLVPPFYVDVVGRAAIERQSASPSMAALSWTAADSVQEMDSHGVEAAVLSVSAPGYWFGDMSVTRPLVRRCNDYLADTVAHRPARFGWFAALPLPDVDACLEEIEYVTRHGRPDGFCIFSSYGDRYPGEQEFAPVFDALNELGAVVFVHPNVTGAAAGLLADTPVSMLEFPLDTTRAAMSLLYGGTLARCADVRFIFSHAGGAIPYLAHRMSRLEHLGPEYAAKVPGGAMALLQRQYYDTALSGNPPQLAALERFVSPGQILYGSDCPFAPGAMRRTIDGIANFEFHTAASASGIMRGNGLRLFPRFGQSTN